MKKYFVLFNFGLESFDFGRQYFPRKPWCKKGAKNSLFFTVKIGLKPKTSFKIAN